MNIKYKITNMQTNQELEFNTEDFYRLWDAIYKQTDEWNSVSYNQIRTRQRTKQAERIYKRLSKILGA